MSWLAGSERDRPVGRSWLGTLQILYVITCTPGCLRAGWHTGGPPLHKCLSPTAHTAASLPVELPHHVQAEC